MEILITGGARGLGRYLALYFNELGHNVVVNYNKSENEAKDLEKNYGLRIIKADVSLEEDVKVMFDKIDKSQYDTSRNKVYKLNHTNN